MTKKYLSLEEAARVLGIAQEELVRLREKGDIRGFADRGNWKFKQDDVDGLARRLQADSSPEVPLYEGEMGEQPTTIRRHTPSDNLLSGDDPESSNSDSDVRLVGAADSGLSFGIDSDSDVKLTGAAGQRPGAEGTDPEFPIYKPGSDSDVKLTASDSDSDVKLVGNSGKGQSSPTGEGGTDSELPLLMNPGSDSDVRLVSSDPNASDISLLGDDDAVAIDFDPDQGHHASVLDDESGIALTGTDSALLMGESGISLAGPSDSGIGLDLNDADDAGLTLALDDDSGISLDAGESGISLDIAESGISLESTGSGVGSGNYSSTVPMMDILSEDDQLSNLEIPVLDGGFDSSDADVTGVMNVQGGGDDVFTLDDEGTEESSESFGEEDDLDLESESFDADQDLDVFDAGEEVFDGADTGSMVSPGVSRLPAAEADWGTVTFVGLALASVLLLVCGVVMIDLVKHTATSNQLNPVSGKLVEMLGGPFKS